LPLKHLANVAFSLGSIKKLSVLGLSVAPRAGVNMLSWLLRRMGLHTDSGHQFGYDQGYHKGLEDGEDFGRRVAYNVTLKNELNAILNRYSQLQFKLLEEKASKSKMQEEFRNFYNKELDRFKMELQDR
jgi:hypothetical protein